MKKTKKPNNIAQHFAPPVPGMGINLESATPPQTRTQDAAKLTAMQAARPLFRPHVHHFVKGKCKVCGEPPAAGART